MEQIKSAISKLNEYAGLIREAFEKNAPVAIASACTTILVIGLAYAAGRASATQPKPKQRQLRVITRPRCTPRTTSLTGITYNIPRSSRDYRNSIALERELNRDFLALPPTYASARSYCNPPEGVDMKSPRGNGPLYDLLSPQISRED